MAWEFFLAALALAGFITALVFVVRCNQGDCAGETSKRKPEADAVVNTLHVTDPKGLVVGGITQLGSLQRLVPGDSVVVGSSGYELVSQSRNPVLIVHASIGHDTLGDGLSLETAFLTVERALEELRSHSWDGRGVISVFGGSYSVKSAGESWVWTDDRGRVVEIAGEDPFIEVETLRTVSSSRELNEALTHLSPLAPPSEQAAFVEVVGETKATTATATATTVLPFSSDGKTAAGLFPVLPAPNSELRFTRPGTTIALTGPLSFVDSSLVLTGLRFSSKRPGGVVVVSGEGSGAGAGAGAGAVVVFDTCELRAELRGGPGAEVQLRCCKVWEKLSFEGAACLEHVALEAELRAAGGASVSTASVLRACVTTRPCIFEGGSASLSRCRLTSSAALEAPLSAHHGADLHVLGCNIEHLAAASGVDPALRATTGARLRVLECHVRAGVVAVLRSAASLTCVELSGYLTPLSPTAGPVFLDLGGGASARLLEVAPGLAVLGTVRLEGEGGLGTSLRIEEAHWRAGVALQAPELLLRGVS